MDSEPETPLAGGHLTTVVRVGNTVRRTSNAWSRTIQGLLRHLESVGVDGAPRALGFDESGREVLSFVEGEVGTGRPPSYVWEENVLVELGQLLRRCHDAAASFTLPQDAIWQSKTREPIETICHNDVAPWNTVFRSRLPVALIDWDWAAPGPRVWDLAFAVWQFVPLFDDEKSAEVGAPQTLREKARRMRLLLDSYGAVLDELFVATILDRMRSTYEGVKGLAEAGDELARRLWTEGAGDGMRREMAFVQNSFDYLADR